MSFTYEFCDAYTYDRQQSLQALSRNITLEPKYLVEEVLIRSIIHDG